MDKKKKEDEIKPVEEETKPVEEVFIPQIPQINEPIVIIDGADTRY